MKNNQIKWRTKREYYDIDTGEQISQYEATTNYIIIKREKNDVYIQNGHGTIKYAIICKRQYERDLFGDPDLYTTGI